jgi:hypothetical protein
MQYFISLSEETGTAVIHLTCNGDELGLNFSWSTACHGRGLCWFYSVHSVNSR